MSGPPRPRLVDHLRVLGLLLLTLLGVIPFLLFFVVGPVATPWIRRRLRQRLGGAPADPADPGDPEPGAWQGRTLFVSAGEDSGDRLAARVVEAIRRRCPGLTVRGYGGPALRAAGADLDQDLVDHAVFGVTAVARSLAFWWRVSARTMADFRETPPDVVLTVDFPGLNGRIDRWARVRGIPAVHLVPPSIWAYAPWRVLRWRRAVDRLLAVFPFEKPLFEASGIPVDYVGHPLFERPLPAPRTPSEWPGQGPVVVELLPGSRAQEIRAHAALLLEAAARVQRRLPRARFVVRLAAPRDLERFRRAALHARQAPSSWEMRVGFDARRGDPPLLGALAASGTVTAELGAALVPMTIFYRVSPWLRAGAALALTAPWIGLVNLIAGREVAPEQVLLTRRSRVVADSFLAVVGEADAWRRAREALATRVREPLAVEGVADRAARAVLAAAQPRLRSHAPVGESATSQRPVGGPS